MKLNDHCGKQPTIEQNYQRTSARAICPECGLHTSYYDTNVEIEIAWNKRSTKAKGKKK